MDDFNFNNLMRWGWRYDNMMKKYTNDPTFKVRSTYEKVKDDGVTEEQAYVVITCPNMHTAVHNELLTICEYRLINGLHTYTFKDNGSLSRLANLLNKIAR